MNTTAAVKNPASAATVMLLGVSFAHLLNDAMQNVVPAAFPIFRESMHLSFAQIGWIAFTLNVTASVLQPLIGHYSDRRPMPLLLPLGMVFTLLGMIGLALSPGLFALIVSAALVGIGSSVLHPESSRVAHMAAGSGRGLAQSIFQVGGNFGQTLSPLLVAFLILPRGQSGFLWLTLLAVVGIAVQAYVSRWYGARTRRAESQTRSAAVSAGSGFSRGYTGFVVSILIVLLFSKFVYLTSMTGYYSFYFMDKYGLPLSRAQLALFALQFAGMVGTLLGGPLADKFGRKTIIWFSIAGTAPFSLLLPYAGPATAVLLCLAIGMILMSGFSVIIVYAQEMLPGRVGMIAGLFFGLAFGLAGLGSVALGWLIDHTGVSLMIRLCAFLPLLGVCAFLLPKDSRLMGRQ
ncbi:MFS transporter [Paenibacillus athensensis]|uniref:MFS transporter n=1 Tax=Paenibacillus athensensis TaxID=1967502 RepID=A0A4Y8Q3X6_9BACL|nr:MFS transporter [Paenibacillus athensensis]MCD1259247.1 MFS transporter [Paenibacillus athensensis]